MCEPITIGAVVAAGTAVSAINSVNQGWTAKQTAERNALRIEGAAKDTVRRGEDDAARVRMAGSAVIGQARANLGASGVDVGTGSAADVQAESRVMAEVDAAMVRRNAALDAWGLNEEANETRRAGEHAKSQGELGAASSVLRGASTIAGMADLKIPFSKKKAVL